MSRSRFEAAEVGLPCVWALVHLAGQGVGCAGSCTSGSVPNELSQVSSASRPAGFGFLKGQLHMHTSGSADSETAPAVAVEWYARRGFDFVVITDHNVVTTPPPSGVMLVLRGMELTQNLRTCQPRPRENEPCLLHTSALFLGSDTPRSVIFPAPSSTERVALYARALERSDAWGGLSVLNHPNFQHAADASLITELAKRGLRFMEVENRAVDSMNEGDATTPPTEAVWDDVLTRGARMYATASDDAHHYLDVEAVESRGETAYVGGRGWVMVRAERDERSIRMAMERGDFYASTGVTLEKLELDRTHVSASVSSGPATFEVYGPGGVVLHRVEGVSVDWPIPPTQRGYVRLRVLNGNGEKALAQPVFLGP